MVCLHAACIFLSVYIYVQFILQVLFPPPPERIHLCVPQCYIMKFITKGCWWDQKYEWSVKGIENNTSIGSC